VHFRSWCSLGHRNEGFKQPKDRVPILFCVSKNGSLKLHPLMIGKSRMPIHLNMLSIDFRYAHNKTACTTAVIFRDWFPKVFIPEIRQHIMAKHLEPKAVLLADNCPAHSPMCCLISNGGLIRMVYLPKNATPYLQPLDRIIIESFIGKCQVGSVSEMVEHDLNYSEFISLVDLRLTCDLICKLTYLYLERHSPGRGTLGRPHC